MIFIDSREQFKDIIQERFQQLNIYAHIMKLDYYTDYLLTSETEVEGVVAIQRKTINEILTQFEEIRESISELGNYGGSMWLLVEEDDLFISKEGKIMSRRGKMLYETGMRAKSYYNFLYSLEKQGISIKTTRNLDFSIWWIYSLHGYIQAEHFPSHTRKYSQAEEVIGCLQRIKGIGEKKAKDIYMTYLKMYDAMLTEKMTQLFTGSYIVESKTSTNSKACDDAEDSIVGDDIAISEDSEAEYNELASEIEEEFGEDPMQ